MIVKEKLNSNVNGIKLGTPVVAELNHPSNYLNRELSWLQFNLRVLEEAQDTTNPLLERVKFLAIFANNLDEFFMIRVSGLIRQAMAGVLNAPPDGMKPLEQLIAIYNQLSPQLETAAKCWLNVLRPGLSGAGIRVARFSELRHKQRQWIREFFESEIFPTLTPLAIDPSHPFPHISNLSLNLAVIIKDPQHGERFARLKVPDTFPRLLPVPEEEQAESCRGLRMLSAHTSSFVWIEDIVAANLDLLFPGLEIVAVSPFRVTRDADLEIEEDEASDLLSTIQESIEMRHFGLAVRLEINRSMPKSILDMLIQHLNLKPYQIFSGDYPIGMSSLMELTKVEYPELKDAPFLPAIPASLSAGEDIFARIRRRDLVLYHPYDSFAPVVDFISQAAQDPNVLAIKQTLYRIGTNSPIVSALIEAREQGKQVAVLVELKARFDEENNIEWAQALEKAGVHVVYGLVGLKTHAKMCLVVRREGNQIVRYIHMSTGNYNVVTSRIYCDLSYFTCDPAIGADVSDLFNALTGYSAKHEYRKLWVAPHTLRQHILDRIDREIRQHRKTGDGSILFKMNSLVDPDCIQALYRASRAGVKIDLQIRSICCLRPGVPGLSENITVSSIVGRFLEHARFYAFHNGGNDELWVGSADLMPRNLDRRIEILFPVDDPAIRQMVRQEIIQVHFRDNTKARWLQPDGTYRKRPLSPGESVIEAQRAMLDRHGISSAEEATETVNSMIAAASEE